MKKKWTFKKIYLIYVSVLVVSVAAASFYVARLLQKYEDSLPEQCVENVIDELTALANEGTFWQQYPYPVTETGFFENNINVAEKYLQCFIDRQVEYFQKTGEYPEDELYYTLHCNGAPLGEIKLKAKGPAVTKLAILSYREWEVEAVSPILEKNDYTLVVPEDFSVTVNGVKLAQTDGNFGGEKKYVVDGVYFAPEFEIKDAKGNDVSYEFNKNRVIADYYYYTLTLPSTLVVKLNGKPLSGESETDSMITYEIRELSKPEVLISDAYGNEISYEGGMKIPFTNKQISAEETYDVKVMGNVVPKDAGVPSDNPEYILVRDYVKNADELPKLIFYNIAVLKNNAEVTVEDKDGTITTLDDDAISYVFSSKDKFLSEVPEEVAKEIDVLTAAKKWSLFMSADVNFSEMSKYLIKDSYQYDVAKKYATGTDIKFISAHTLRTPPFTEETVSNFVWITEDSFSVDISFVKHMVLTVGSRVDDPMNDRFYFVKYDDTDDGIDNAAWKIAGMKEIVEHAE